MANSERNIVALDSVGSGIDPETGYTYPQWAKGGYDFEWESHVEENAFEWWDNLSEDDKTYITEELGFDNPHKNGAVRV